MGGARSFPAGKIAYARLKREGKYLAAAGFTPLVLIAVRGLASVNRLAFELLYPVAAFVAEGYTMFAVFWLLWTAGPVYAFWRNGRVGAAVIRSFGPPPCGYTEGAPVSRPDGGTAEPPFSGRFRSPVGFFRRTGPICTVSVPRDGTAAAVRDTAVYLGSSGRILPAVLTPDGWDDGLGRAFGTAKPGTVIERADVLYRCIRLRTVFIIAEPGGFGGAIRDEIRSLIRYSAARRKYCKAIIIHTTEPGDSRAVRGLLPDRLPDGAVTPLRLRGYHKNGMDGARESGSGR